MNILMVTNTYTPIVGGVERSIRLFSHEYRKRGHRVLIVTLEFDNMPEDEEDIVHVPAIRRFNGSDFSIRMPIPFDVSRRLAAFKPDVVHAHHPFILGDTALRISNKYQIPLVYTFHTRYEEYTHYVPIELPGLKKFVTELTCGYAEMADVVFAPSVSIRKYLDEHQVKTAVEVVPTGVDLSALSHGNGETFRARHHIAHNAHVIGHVGRLAKEKNLSFLMPCIHAYLHHYSHAVFVLVGKGPAYDGIYKEIKRQGLESQFVYAGLLEGQELTDAYHAMDVFVFSSKSETQGLVLLEAMAAGTPVVALHASGVSDVVDGKNGIIVREESREKFFAAIDTILQASDHEKNRLKKEAHKTAQGFSIDMQAQKALAVYDRLIRQSFVYCDIENSLWSKALASIRSEWELFGNFAGAVGNSLKQEESCRETWLTRCLRWMNPNEWSVRLLNVDRSEHTATETGIVFIQIDGLSMRQLKKAMRSGKLPFLQRLMKKEHYELKTLYSGLPSSTPAVQAELFYGVKGAVPSFSFLDRATQHICKMYDDEDARLIEERLAQRGIGLLEGGSSYSNVYSGGAKETQFCAVDLGWDILWAKTRPLKMGILAVLHFLPIVRTIFFMVIECVLSLCSFLNGVLVLRQNIIKELKFILTRISFCVLLRDLVSFGARIDITRGLPVVHVNFVGYDEHAHRRGPSSRFAFRTLKGINHCIERIYKEAMRSQRRDYDVWIYADHGQSEVFSYAVEHSTFVHAAIRKVYRDFRHVENGNHDDHTAVGVELLGAHYFAHPIFHYLLPVMKKNTRLDKKEKIVITAMGPIGHVYTFDELTTDEVERFARSIVADAHVPLVLFPHGVSQVKAITADAEYLLPQDAELFWGDRFAWMHEATRDLVRIVHHPNAGTVTICGWHPESSMFSFPIEEGAHGGLSIDEMTAFALMPADVLKPYEKKEYIRPSALREAAFKVLKKEERKHIQVKIRPSVVHPEQQNTLRIMTYNVHGCRGIDSKVYPERIARVIARLNPDIVALQELDMHRDRSGGIDQPHLLANILRMKYHFFPSISVEEEHYGNALLSRFPMQVVRADTLTRLPQFSHLEPRGCLWVTCMVRGKKVHCLNTHLGLNYKERWCHIQELLGESWLGGIDKAEPIIFVGDFNAIPSSKLIKEVCKSYNDVQVAMHNHEPVATWFGHFPVGRIDHIFVSPGISIKSVHVPKTQLEKVASDHLPLITDISL